jgi:putative DNA primase/helicase
MNFDDLKPQKRWVCYYTVENKKPMDARRGTDAKSTDPSTWSTYDEAVAGAKRFRFAGVGFVVHDGDDVCGIDLDECLTPVTTDEGEEALERSAFAKHIMSLAPSYTELSPGGDGLHIIGFGKMHRGINTKVKGNRVEQYATGRYFTYTGKRLDDTPTEFVNIQDAIDEIYELIEEEKTKSFSKLASMAIPSTSSDDEHLAFVYQTWTDRAVDMMRNAYVGNRHNTRIRAGRLMGGALAALRAVGYPVMSDDEAIRLIYDTMVPDPGDQRTEYRAIEDGLNYGLQAPLEIWQRKKAAALPPPMATSAEVVPLDTAEVMPKTYHHTDVGNGLRFADHYAGTVCYVSEWQQWMVWSGKRWERTDDVAMRRLAHDLVLTMYRDAVSDGKLDQELAKWAIKSEAAARVNAMLDSAQPYLLVSSALFDAQHDVVNVANGMIDLATGDVRPHDPLAYHTKLIDVNYDDRVSMEWWVNFLITVFDGDVGLIDYMQRAIGYTLTGRTDEHCLFFCYGTGKNGKSTFMHALETLMGSYSTVTSVEALLDATKSGESATPYMAKLPGMRLAMAQEMPEGRRFNESLVKSITGGDTISARDMYKSVFQFTPTHKLWITGNHLPRISGTDDGIWRRLRIVPFTVTIPEEKRKDSRVLEAELRQHIGELLRWAVLGAQQWLKHGLGSCKAVDMATATYRGEEDAVQRFITERCQLNSMATIGKGTLFSAWREWVDDEGDRAMSYKSQRWLMRQLVGRFGCQAGGNGRTSLVGIRLIPDDADYRST